MNMLKRNAPLQNTWFAKGGQAVMGSIWGTTQRIGDYFSLRSRNDSLASENFALSTRIAELEKLISDSMITERIPNDGIIDGYRYIPAKVVKLSSNTQHNYLILGIGSVDGVSEGDGVITRKGAVGVVDGVSENFSFVRSFQNHNMSISTRIGRTGFSGALVWDGIHSNKGLLKEIPHHVEFAPGDTIFTNGFSTIFPPDIPVGLTGESRIVNGSSYEIKIDLFEDFGALRYVTVVSNLGKDEIRKLEEGR